MANSKVSALTSKATPVGADTLYLVDSVGTASKKCTLLAAMAMASPTLTTPVLGVATATSINGYTLTTPVGGATLTLATGSTFVTVGAFTITLTATAGTGVTLPTSGTLATLAGSETLSTKTLTTPIIAQINDTGGNAYLKGAATALAVNQLTITNSAAGAVGANAVALTATGTDAAISLSMAPKGATGIMTIGLSTGTGDIILGSSSGSQTVKIGNGAGVASINIGNVSVVGVNVGIANVATGNGITDTIGVATGNAAGTGIKVVQILTGVPNTTGNNRLTMGGGTKSSVTTNAVVTDYQATNRVTGTAVANAPVGTLTDASGSNITVTEGLRITLKLAAGLQAGANTLNLNGHGADSIVSHRNPGANIGTAYVLGGANPPFVDLVFDGGVWQDMSQ